MGTAPAEMSSCAKKVAKAPCQEHLPSAGGGHEGEWLL